MAKTSKLTALDASTEASQTAIPKLAIACQGGGAHTAFTAGVLAYLFLAFQHFEKKNQQLPVELIGLSGTSGGALTAAMAWGKPPAGCKEPWAEGARRVLRFWQSNKALPSLDPFDPLKMLDGSINAWYQWIANWGNWMPTVEQHANPYLSEYGKNRVRQSIRNALGISGDTIQGRPGVAIHIGACDIVNPGPEARPDTPFTAFPPAGKDLTIPQLLASIAIPELFLPEELQLPTPPNGQPSPHYFWDGLFSQNPPINNFFSDKDVADKPDLLWVIQINPSSYQPRDGEDHPTTVMQIQDRRNELACNLSLGHELNTIETINAIYADLKTNFNVVLQKHKPVTYSLITINRLNTEPLDYPSKLNRDPAFIDKLIQLGIKTAFAWASQGHLTSPHCHRTGKQGYACSFNLPVWPKPAELSGFLDDEPILKAIWSQSISTEEGLNSTSSSFTPKKPWDDKPW